MCTTGMYTLLSSMSVGYNDILNKKEKKSLTTMHLVFLHCQAVVGFIWIA